MSLELQPLQQVTDGYNIRKCVEYSLINDLIVDTKTHFYFMYCEFENSEIL